ncbi:MAG: ATP-binding protein [Bacteroidales bacterium]|jgi:hypothetical protein|nr:ATP-binding protein [Bacteroidales bacterium]
MQNLPIGIQSFEKLRNGNFIYVDKTKVIHDMIEMEGVYFLSRPRRFGKSLTVSTMDAIFSGRRELFEGLWIYDRWDWTRKYPVIRIDWTRISHSTLEVMNTSLCGYIQDIAKSYSVSLTKGMPSDCFDELIRLLHQTTGEKAVILIDEYDKPVTSHLFDPHLNPVRTAVHDFYQVMKGADEHIRFIFLTGVSKFSGLSVFSALNNLNDISMLDKYAAICGYTQEELESNFPSYIDGVAANYGWTREKTLDVIRMWYDGYSWDAKTRVYNPYSTLLFFENGRFSDYWFQTGTPTFLIEILQRRQRESIVLEDVKIGNILLNGYDPQTLSEVPLFFQTGYLTVKGIESTEYGTAYTLGVPNMEVNRALLTEILLAYGNYPSDRVDVLREKVAASLRNCDEQGFADCLETLVATVPNELKMNSEAHYHALVLIWLRFLGLEVHPEVSSHFGRADAVWKQPGLTVVAELKYGKKEDAETLLDRAMTQIHEKKYYSPYTGKVLLLGVAFSGTEIRCRMEVMDSEGGI